MGRETSSKIGGVPIPQNLEEADSAFGLLAEEYRALVKIGNELNEKIAKLKEKAKEEAALHREHIEELHAVLAAYSGAHRRELTDEGRQKFYDTTSGRGGWRLRRTRVEVTGDEQDVVKQLEKEGLDDCIRIKKEVKKTDLLRRLTTPGVSLEIEGVEVVPGGGEVFYIRLTALDVEFTPDVKKLKKSKPKK